MRHGSSKIKRKKYQVLFNGVGYKFVSESWYNLDIGIWEKEKIKPFLKKDKLIPFIITLFKREETK